MVEAATESAAPAEPLPPPVEAPSFIPPEFATKCTPPPAFVPPGTMAPSSYYSTSSRA
jgi:hypothetical protein